MKTLPKISVIIPMFNVQKFVGACLESLTAQTFTSFEVVVVNDCSTDNSRAIAESYLEKLPMKLVDTRKNSGGGGHPRNLGLKISRGDYVFFPDADDILIPNALEELYISARDFEAEVVYLERHFEANEDLSAIQIAGDTCGEMTLMTRDPAERIRTLVNGEFFLTTCSKFCRRDFLIEHEIFFPTFAPAEDDIWTVALILNAQRILRVPTPFYVWRLTENSALRKVRSPKDALKFWLKPIVHGLKLLDNLMSRHDFFRFNPQYRCAVFEFFVHSKAAQIFDDSLKLSAAEILMTIEDTFGDDLLISWLLTELLLQQKSFARLKNI